MKISTKNASHLLWAALAAASFFAGKSLTDEGVGNPASPRAGTIRKSAIQKVARSANRGLDSRAHRQPRATTPGNKEDPVHQQLAYLQLLADLSPGNIKAALACLAKQAPDSMAWSHNAKLLFQAWAHQDPDAALARAAEFAGYGNAVALAGALTGLAETDPAAACQWLENHKANLERTAAVVEGMAHSDPEEATRFVTGLSSGDNRRGLLIEIIAGEQTWRGLSTATTWAQNLDDPELRQVAFASVARQLSITEGAEAGAGWIQQAAGQPEAAEAIEVVAQTWAEEDAAASARWLQSLPDGAGNPVLAEVVGRWTMNDPVQAANFLNGLNNSPVRSQAVYQFAMRLSPSDPAGACEWAASIGDSRLRMAALRSALRKWNQTDPAAASQWNVQNDG